MKPNLSFHRIASMKLTPVEMGTTSDGPFWSRDLILTDETGEALSVGLFSDTETGLVLPEEKEAKP